jgi:hypothetical protein
MKLPKVHIMAVIKAFTTILDEGVIKKVNLAQWFQTTTLGGGFVSFKRIQ